MSKDVRGRPRNVKIASSVIDPKVESIYRHAKAVGYRTGIIVKPRMFRGYLQAMAV